MKRYLLFAGDNYYPAGGWEDFIASFDTVKEAEDYAREHRAPWPYEWWHIVDLIKGKMTHEEEG